MKCDKKLQKASSKLISQNHEILFIEETIEIYSVYQTEIFDLFIAEITKMHKGMEIELSVVNLYIGVVSI